MEAFREKIRELYILILNPIDEMFKLTAIELFKKEFKIQDNKTIGEYYYDSLKINKEKGIVYTPYPIAKYIVENTITSESVIKNPFIKIIDPSCGAGNLLIPCFLHLVNLYKENLKEINKKNKLKLKEEDINDHIVKNNIYGFDIDDIAIKILQIDLFYNSNSSISENLINEDFLLWKEDNRFDIFIGNPPYVGPKFIDKNYSLILKDKFKEIYKDKGDLSYCFFKKALDTLNNKGKISFITSRYFLESSSGKELRKTLNENTRIKRIVDFYGIRPFKGIGIDPVIIFMEKDKGSFEEVEVIKPLSDKGRKNDKFYSSLFLNEGEDYNRFYIKQSTLQGERWILRSYEIKNIIKKIESKCNIKLMDICTSHQGIITGCDKAFVVNSEVIEDENLEKDLLKPWIKGSFIKQNQVNRQNSFIIYSDLIEDESKYPNCIKHIEPYKEKLKNRRECLRGVRKWYQLQWGRKKEIFDNYKIIFPFKASSNKFSLDFGSYFSADVYALRLKEESEFNYEFLLFILNSKIYEFYFKTFAKKLGEDLYEYYPNNLMKLLIPPINEIGTYSEGELYKYFLLTTEEIEIINQSI
ncbi:MAG: N-6 DNA methylase [Clostridium argentinense]|uniref:site-specific DNA-methyltransferase (adenine-specific) n=1 Tax=Clostridium faecium TaxID=2762223 RepID=A0ABR8YWB7_9CLOT|nr:TaqI-like C-terminal specificity domain-containing protein [Clostridium faecium]MBD8048568.1 N-6 DNA methylase [Clostridium faecium]MBS5822616.1 N-6 DNA methylase [Clostridium argentinense]